MEMTLFFAKAYGLFFLFVGLALFLSPERFRAWYSDILSQDRRALFGGTIALLIGSFIVAAHNVWVADWPVFITLIGYWGVVKGAGLLMSRNFVEIFRGMVNAPTSIYRFSGLAWAAIGLFLAYQGFMI